MCVHRFVFPEDKPENYNGGRTLTGRCKCGAIQEAYGMKWMIRKHDDILAMCCPVLPEPDCLTNWINYGKL